MTDSRHTQPCTVSVHAGLNEDGNWHTEALSSPVARFHH